MSIAINKLVTLAVCSAVTAACSDSLSTVLIPNPSEPVEVSLFDFNDASLLDPAAYDLLNDVPVRTDQVGPWDFLFAIAESGAATLQPRSAVTGEDSDAGLQQASEAFAQATEAPMDGYTEDEPIVVNEGDVLFGVSRRNPVFSIRCRLFARFEVLSIDAAALQITLRYVRNPNCERTDLQLGES